MNKQNLIVVGAGGHASASIDVIEQCGTYRIVGLIGVRGEVGSRKMGYEVIATDDDLPILAKEYEYLFIAVGQILSPDSRIRIYQKAIELGFRLPTIVAPTAYISNHASIGAGTIVMHRACINAGTVVGANCIVNSQALIEHDAIVEDHCHVSTGSIINGGVRVGVGTFIGSGCVVREGVSLGANCVIGMGALVRHNQSDNTKYVG